jgi:hypothetical protein
MTELLKHPEALAIAKRGNSVNWDMGDYLLKVAGKPSESRANNGSFKAIAEVADELAENGYPQFSTKHMSQLREVAHDFPASYRVISVSWTTHREAGTPEILAAVIEAAKAQGRKGVSKRFVMQIINGMHADRNAKRKSAEIKARKIAEKAERERQQAMRDKESAQKRQDELAAKAAEKREQEANARAEHNRGRARKLRGAPKRDKSKPLKSPKPEEVPLLVAKSKFMADSAEAKALVRRMDREIDPHIDDLSKAYIVGCVEELLEIAELFRKLATKLNRNQIEKRAHLHAVGE